MIDVVTHVYVLGHWVEVQYLEELDCPDTNGTYNGYRHTIEICIDQTAEELHRTLIHELAHAVFDISGINHFVPKKAEEAVCCMVEHFSDWIRFDRNSDKLRWEKKDITPKCDDPSLRG